MRLCNSLLHYNCLNTIGPAFILNFQSLNLILIAIYCNVECSSFLSFQLFVPKGQNDVSPVSYSQIRICIRFRRAW